MDVLIN